MVEPQFAFEQQQFPNPQAEKKHMFGHKPGMNNDIIQLSNETKDIGRRLRTLEERYSNLQTKTQIIEQNMISRHKQLSTEVKTINTEINEIKKEVLDVKDKILLIIREIQTYSKKEEVKVLEKYIQFWEPLNFVTRNEVKDIINEILKQEGVIKKIE
ncbi:MAG: hypothetical protein AABY14_00275 [Nanoarchaeota archaeon]